MKRTSLIFIIILLLYLNGCGLINTIKSNEKEDPSPSPVEQSLSDDDTIVDTTIEPIHQELSDGYSVEGMTEAFKKYRGLCAWLDPDSYQEYYNGETKLHITLYGNEDLSKFYIVETIDSDDDILYNRYTCNLSEEGNIFVKGPYSFTELLKDKYIKLIDMDVSIETPQNPEFGMHQIEGDCLPIIESCLKEFLNKYIIDYYWGSTFDVYATGFYEEYPDLVEIAVVVDNAKVIPLILRLYDSQDNSVRANINFKTIVDSHWMNREITCGDILPINVYGHKKLRHIKESAVINFKLSDDKGTRLNDQPIYLHNTKGRRTAKLIGDKKTTYIYDDYVDYLVVSENHDGEIIEYTYSDYPHIFGCYVNSMYYRDSYYELHLDEDGSITHITDDNGHIVARYEYGTDGIAEVLGKDDEGNWVNKEGNSDFIGNINKLRLNGYYFDDETGYYYHLRYYIDSKNNFEFINDEVMQLFID